MATARPPQQSDGQRRPRILRIGILLGGKIVEERLIRERTSVSIGQSMRNTFSVPAEGLPMELPLFVIDTSGRYHLRFLAKMDGRLGDSSGSVNTLEALKAKGAQNMGDYYQIPLSDSSRGKLSLGDLTILFQFVTEPPRQPKPMLPASVRGTFADRLDPRLSVIMGSSIIAHFAIVIVALLGDVEEEGIAQRAYNLTFKQDTFQVEPVLPPEPTQGSAAGSAAEGPKTPEKKPDKGQKTPEKDDGGRSSKDSVAMSEDDAARFADLLTGEGPNGTSEGDMSKRRPGADLGSQINDVKDSGGKVAIGGGAGRGSRGDGDPRVGTGGGLNTKGPGGETIGTGKTEEKGPAGRISVSDKQSFDESTLTPDEVLRKIQQAYMAGLKRCYKQYLNKDASARGKVTLALTINETGKTTKGSANGFADEVDSCISGQMSSWRFPVPKDKDGEAVEAAFSITLQLVPD